MKLRIVREGNVWYIEKKEFLVWQRTTVPYFPEEKAFFCSEHDAFLALAKIRTLEEKRRKKKWNDRVIVHEEKVD